MWTSLSGPHRACCLWRCRSSSWGGLSSDRPPPSQWGISRRLPAVPSRVSWWPCQHSPSHSRHMESSGRKCRRCNFDLRTPWWEIVTLKPLILPSTERIVAVPVLLVSLPRLKKSLMYSASTVAEEIISLRSLLLFRIFFRSPMMMSIWAVLSWTWWTHWL